MLFPARCVACGSAADVLCAPLPRAPAPAGPAVVRPLRCTDGLAGVAVPRVQRASARVRHCARRGDYAGPARPFVAAWKEHGLRRAADLAAELVVEALAPPAADVITYIPPDPERLLRRGHHPAARARAVGSATAWGIDHAALLDVPTGSPRRPRQAGLARADRLSNARKAFEATGLSPLRVVLVDDVYTTGATVAAGAARSATRGREQRRRRDVRANAAGVTPAGAGQVGLSYAHHIDTTAPEGGAR